MSVTVTQRIVSKAANIRRVLDAHPASDGGAPRHVSGPKDFNKDFNKGFNKTGQ